MDIDLVFYDIVLIDQVLSVLEKCFVKSSLMECFYYHLLYNIYFLAANNNIWIMISLILVSSCF